jgi:hypothetical protein
MHQLGVLAALYIYKDENKKLLVVLTHAQKTKLIKKIL